MTNQQVFLEILREFIHPQDKPSKVEEPDKGDWEEILELGRIHAVLPIIYEAAWKSGSFGRLPDEIRKKYRLSVKQMVFFQTRATAFFLEDYRSLCEAGVFPLVMKGIVCRLLYRLPDYRVSGDEDVLIEREAFEKADRVLLNRGFAREQGDDPSGAQEITYVHPDTGLRLEVHLTLFPEESGSYGHLNEEFPEVFRRGIVVTDGETKLHTLCETQHMLYLLCHGLKHFLHSGFGIRQLCDMILFAEANGERIDWKEIEERTKRQNMYIFWMNLFDIGERYLGFSWEKAGLQKPVGKLLDSEALLKDILLSGIFGKSSGKRIHSANMTLQASDRTEKKRSGMMASLFPGFDYMSRKYPYLLERKWLLWAAWIQRITAYRKEIRGENAMQAVRIGKKRVELLKKYGIIE